MTEQQIIETLATKVMGWCSFFWVDNEFIVETSSGSATSWNPLQNIADAWQVVEKLEKEFDAVYVGNTPDGWRCHFQRMMPPEEFDALFSVEEYAGEGKTVQEAIYNAAIKVVEGKA